MISKDLESDATYLAAFQALTIVAMADDDHIASLTIGIQWLAIVL